MNKKEKLIKSALELYGLNETIGGQTNPEMLKLVNNVSEHKFNNNVPWCAAYVGSLLKNNDFQYSVLLTARSYLKVGTSVKKPELGDIIIFWRGNPNGWKGHVGFYISEDKNSYYVLGGNQNNMVCIKPYPKKQLLGIRRPAKKSPMAVGKVEEKES